MEKQIKRIINKVKQCVRDVYKELGPGWNETVCQKAHEERGINVELDADHPGRARVTKTVIKGTK